MKRILSWVVLYLISVIISLLTSLVVGVAGYVLGLVSELNTFLQIAIYILGGTTFLSLVFAPVYYGTMLTVFACEAIRPSKKGTRYIVYSIWMLISNIIHIVVGLSNHTFHFNAMIMCIYYIMLIIYGKNAALENND